MMQASPDSHLENKVEIEIVEIVVEKLVIENFVSFLEVENFFECYGN